MGLLRVLAVLVVSAPFGIVGTFMLGPLWSWIEARFGIEAVGHAMYAGWCFAATYAATALLGLALLAWSRPKSSSPPASD
jgi:hypothetical protein